jgi:hypothetical protein
VLDLATLVVQDFNLIISEQWIKLSVSVPQKSFVSMNNSAHPTYLRIEVGKLDCI